MRTIAIILALLTPSLVAAQPNQDDLTWIVELLDSPDWAVRQAFTDKLEHDRHIGLREIESLMRDADVSPEVRLRLANVAKTRFFQASNRAAVGMGPLNDNARVGITVARLQDGFDAERVLRRGDRVVQAQGRLVRDWDRFRALILSNDPGDLFEVLVVRDGETLELSFQLGQYSNLENGQNIEPSILEEAWQIRLADAGDIKGPVADTGFDAENTWRKDKMLAQADWPSDHTTRMRGGRPERSAVAGHQAVFDWGDFQRFGSGRADFDRDVASRREQLDIYRDYLATQSTVLEGLKRRLEDPSLDEETRKALVNQIERRSSAINNVKRWIEEEAERSIGG